MNERELLSWMTPEQRKAWRAARRSGGDTDLQIGFPVCGADGLFWPYQNDDGEWCEQWTGTYFDVCDGKACVFDWTCTDGDFDTSYRCTLREYTEKEQARDLEQACEAEREYNEQLRARREGERAAREAERANEATAIRLVEAQTKGLLQRDTEELCTAMENAGLTTVYGEMTPAIVGKVVEFIVNWRKENEK